MGKQAPAPPDYTGAATKQADSSAANVGAQTAANRPNQTNAFGSSVTWGVGPDGKPTQTQSFGGGMDQYADRLQGQLAGTGAMDWNQFGKLGNGEQARDQAINSAYGQATSRLDPQWQQRETQMRSRLANQGLDPNSEAARGLNQQFGQQRNDAYTSAMASAVAQGQSAGDSVFRNNAAARQMMVAEALRKRSLPLEELRGLAGFLGQQGFMGAQSSDPTAYLQAAGLQGNAEIDRWRAQNEANADAWGGGMEALGVAGKLYGLG